MALHAMAKNGAPTLSVYFVLLSCCNDLLVQLWSKFVCENPWLRGTQFGNSCDS